MENAQTALRMELKNNEPIEVGDLGAALTALAEEYREYTASNSPDIVAKDVRLYVRTIRPGSTIADFVALAPLALPFIENANSVMSFGQYIATLLNGLLLRNKKPEVGPKSLENAIRLVEPVAKDNASQMNIQLVAENQTINNYITINSVQANAVQNAARRELQQMAEPILGTRRNVVLVLHQARSDPRSRAGDRGRIESIYPASVKLLFENDGLKAAMVGGDDNPFKFAYVVDVDVETVHGRPVLYKVTALHDRMEISDQTDAA